MNEKAKSGTMTWEDLKAEAIKKLGYEFGIVFIHLKNEVLTLESNWNEFVILFGTNKERINLMNQVAKHFFGILQSSMFENTLLHIARVTDPAETKVRGQVRKNLTFYGLEALVDHAETKQAFKVQVDKAFQAASFAREWRNKRIAHSDLIHATDDSAELPAASRLLVRKCLDELRKALEIITLYYYDQPMPPTPFFFENAKDLLYHLRDGQKWRDWRLAENLAGRWDSELDKAEEI